MSGRYERVMSSVAWGPYHKMLTIVCGCINASDSVAVTSLSFVIPNASATLNISDEEKGLLMSIVFVGMMVGGLVWGSAGDRFGRRYCLMWSLSLNGIAAAASSMAPSVGLLMLFQFLSGVGVGGTIPLVFTFFSECLPVAKRGQYVVILASFWMVGSIFVAALAWYIIPGERVYFTINGMEYTSWRMFMLLTGGPAFFSAMGLRFFYDSPLFYYNSGRYNEAWDILRAVHEINCGETLPRELYATFGHDPVTQDTTDDTDNTSELAPLVDVPLRRTSFSTRPYSDPPPPSDNYNHPPTPPKNTDPLHLYRKLMRQPLRRTTLKMGLLWITLSYGYYGLTSWFPAYFKIRFGTLESSMSIYESTFLIAIAQLPANVLSAYTVDYIGRGPTLAVSMGLSGAAAVFIPFVRTSESIVLMSAIFTGVSVAGWNSLDIISSEQFPADVRSTGFGLLTVLGRIASIVATTTFGKLVHSNPAYPILLTALFLFIGCVTALRIPEVKRDKAR